MLFDGPQAADRSVVCIDDEWGRRMAQRAAARPVMTVSTSAEATETDITARQLSTEATGAQQVELMVSTGEHAGSYEFRLPMPGTFNIANAALATGMAAASGIEPRVFLEGVEKVAVPGRMERIDRGQQFVAVVDYAHKPAAVTAVLDTLRAQPVSYTHLTLPTIYSV